MFGYCYDNVSGISGSGGGWIMMIGWVIIIALIAIAFFRYIPAMSHNNSSSKNVLDILNERYVKGEISYEEYTRMKSEIKN